MAHNLKASIRMAALLATPDDVRNHRRGRPVQNRSVGPMAQLPDPQRQRVWGQRWIETAPVNNREQVPGQERFLVFKIALDLARQEPVARADNRLLSSPVPVRSVRKPLPSQRLKLTGAHTEALRFVDLVGSRGKGRGFKWQHA